MKIVDIATTVLNYPHVNQVEDATFKNSLTKGRGQLFVHILSLIHI